MWSQTRRCLGGEITSNLSKTVCRWAGVGIEREEGMKVGREEEGRGGMIVVTRE